MIDATTEAVFAAASRLSESDRLALVLRLLDDLPVEGVDVAIDDPDLAAELERRLADEAGEISWSQLRAES